MPGPARTRAGSTVWGSCDFQRLPAGCRCKPFNGDEFRAEIAAENGATRKARLRAQYLWIKTNWFRGVEFKRGAAAGANVTIDGLQCLRDECPLE